MLMRVVLGRFLSVCVAAMIAAGFSSPSVAATEAGAAIAPVIPMAGTAENPAQPDAVEPDAWIQPKPEQPAQKPLKKIPLPLNGYGTDKLGDDLIVHAPDGDYAKHDFLKGQKPGELRTFGALTAGHGACTMQVDAGGETVSMMCER
jgi:hypothetical protein